MGPVSLIDIKRFYKYFVPKVFGVLVCKNFVYVGKKNNNHPITALKPLRNHFMRKVKNG